MEAYWRLASADAGEREAATAELLRSLLQEQQAHEHSDENRRGDTAAKDELARKTPVKISEKREKKAHRKRKRMQSDKAEEEEATTIAALTDENGALDDEGQTMTALRDIHSSLGNSHIVHSNGSIHDGEDPHNCSPSVRYALGRLIRGVASSRECARQGFAMALASLLEAMPSLKSGPVLKLIIKTLEVTSSMKGQEKRDAFLGQLFALGAVVRAYKQFAGAMDVADLKDAKEIAELLLALSKRKSFLREPAIILVTQFFGKLSTDALQHILLNSPLLQEILSADFGNTNAETLQLALGLYQKLPHSLVESCPLLPNSKNPLAIFESSHLRSLLTLLQDSTSCHPRVHSIWSVLADSLFSESSDQGQLTPSKKKKKKKRDHDTVVGTTEQAVAMFWKLVVDNSLLPSSHERKFLAMELVRLLLPRLPASCVHIVLSNTFVRCLLDILAAEGNLLYKSAQTCLSLICDCAKTDDAHLVAVILSLQHTSYGKFDTLSRTKTVKELMSLLLKSKDGCFSFYCDLVQLFNGEKLTTSLHPFNVLDDGHHDEKLDLNGNKNNHEGKGVKQSELQRYWVIDQIFTLAQEIKDSDLRQSLQRETVKFLTANALFISPSGIQCYLKELDTEFQFPKIPVSENIRKLCLSRLQSLLSNLSVVGPAAQEKSRVIEKTGSEVAVRSDLIFYFVESCDGFDEVSEISRARPIVEDDKGAVVALRTCLSQICSAAVSETSHEQTQKLWAMHALLMQILLQSVTTGGNDITSELIMCCRQAFGDVFKGDDIIDHSDHGTGDVLFMDVLVEILLSLLAQSSSSIRSASEQVFKSFCGDLTESNMMSLVRVIKKQLHHGRRLVKAPSDTEDSDDDQFVELEESDVNSDDKDGIVVNDYEENNKFEESNGKLPHQAELETYEDDKQEFKESDARDDEMDDVEDHSGSDMDDEAMFRIDVHLANLLKQRRGLKDKGEEKDAQTQLSHFKFRVLSLLEYFFQRKASSPLCLVALPGLLQALVASSSSSEGNLQLADRIRSVLQNKLLKSKEYPKGPGVDKTVVSSLLQRCMRRALRCKIMKVGQVFQSCTLWLLKILQAQGSEASEEFELLVKGAMNDFFNQRKCRLKASFFRELFSRFPGISFVSLNLLIESCTEARTEFLRQEALQLLNFILQANSGKGHCQFRESISQNLSSLSSLLASLIEKPPSNKMKKSDIRRYCVLLLKTVAQELPEKSVKKHIGKSVYSLCISHFGPSITDGIGKSNGVGVVHESTNTKKKLHQQKSGCN